MIQSIRTRWAGDVACVVERRGAYRVLMGKLEGKNHLEDPGVDGKIILRWMSRKWDVRGHGLARCGQDMDTWLAFVRNFRVP